MGYYIFNYKMQTDREWPADPLTKVMISLMPREYLEKLKESDTFNCIFVPLYRPNLPPVKFPFRLLIATVSTVRFF